MRLEVSIAQADPGVEQHEDAHVVGGHIQLVSPVAKGGLDVCTTKERNVERCMPSLMPV